MKNGLHPGYRGDLQWTVDADRVITLGGDARATVFSTPNMILLMERAAREALRPWLEDGEESVGIDVNIQHLAGAGLGAEVRGTAVVTSIDGRRVHFSVECWCGERLLGQGTHTRAVVSLQKLIDNLAAVSAESHPQNLHASAGQLPAFQTLLVEVTEQIATVRFNRPASLNAVNVRMTEELEQLVAFLAGHPQQIRVVLLTGAGDAFCAGDDVIELPALDEHTARQLSLRQAAVYLAFERLPQPIIALLNGDAFGAGCVAACAADLRIAAHNSRLAMPEICLGWPPGYGLAQLTALIGKSRALEMCLLGQPVSATTALEWGLVSEVTSAARLKERGLQIARRMLAMPAVALRETKRVIHLDEGTQPKVAHRADTEAYIRCLQQDDAREGLRAFAEKRSPRFTQP